MKISKTLSVLLLFIFILSACTFPTKAPKATATVIPTPTATVTSTTTEASPALPDYSSSVYLDDRSTPAALVLSYINAINSHHFVRAYSYWVGPDPILGSLADFTHFVEGIESETVSLGAVITEGAAGSLYYTLPAALTVHLSGGGTDKYSACFVIRLPQPGNYGAPPIQPMHFTSNTTILAADAWLSDEQILAMTRSASEGLPVEPAPLRKLDRRARVILGLFAGKDVVSTQEMAAALGLSDRMVLYLMPGWVKDGWIVLANTSRRSRAYKLSEIYQKYIRNNPPK